MPQISRFLPLDEQLHIFANKITCRASYGLNLGIFLSSYINTFGNHIIFRFLAHQKTLKSLAPNFPGVIFQVGFWDQCRARHDRRRPAVLFVDGFEKFPKHIP